MLIYPARATKINTIADALASIGRRLVLSVA